MRAACNILMGLLSICCVSTDLAGMHYYVDYGPSEAQYTQSLVSGLSCTLAPCTASCRQYPLLSAMIGIEAFGCVSGLCTRCQLCFVQDVHRCQV